MHKNNSECLCVHSYVQREEFKNKKSLLMENYFIFSKGRPFFVEYFFIAEYIKILYMY